MSANEQQIGGSHYKVEAGQEEHWDRVHRLGLDYFQGQITKYVERHKLKGGLADLQKAKHFIEKYIEVYYLPNLESWIDVSPPPVPPISAAEFDGLETVPAALDDKPACFDFHLPTEIFKFNRMYGLPMPVKPGMYEDGEGKHPYARLVQFKKILLDEVGEVDEIIAGLSVGEDPLETMTKLADWLGDIQVYAASEMARWGIPWSDVLKDIMNAQWSKLGADGNPIVKDGKVQKGPNYVAPEPAIRRTLIKAGMPAIATREVGPMDTQPTEKTDFRGAFGLALTPREAADLRGRLDLHEDEQWQCEGFYGDCSQLYRHRGSRKLIRASSLSAAHDWLKAQAAG